jgi:ribosomal protein S18 acetylase RimI-like enzyme
VQDPKTRFHFIELASTVFALPFQISEQIYGPESTWNSPMSGYVGYIAGRHVSIVATVVGGDSIGVYSLATAPQFQGRGYAETLMRYAIAEAMKTTGLHRSVLQTTRSGKRLYERMGYKSVTKFTVYTRESCGSV